MTQILIADDEPFILRSLAFTLRQEQFEVLTAKNGQEALEVLANHDIDLAFLDIMMPIKSGFDVLEQLNLEGNLPCPIIFLTAKGMDGDKERALDLGVSEYVTKPFSPADVVALVRKHCGEKQ